MKIITTTFLLFFVTISYAQVSNNMTLLDQYDVDTLPSANGLSYNDCWGYVDCDGSEYAILGSASRIHFINVTNPTDIEEIASFPGGEVTIWRDMKTYKDRAYAVSDNTNEGLLIFDLSDLPNSVSKTYQSNEHFGKAHDIFIDEPNGRLYVVGTDTQSQGVIVFDVAANPDNPPVIGAINFPGGGYVHDLFVMDNIAYCSHGYEGFYIWDMTNASNPVLIASQVTGGYNHSSWISDDGSFVVFAEEVPKGMPLGVLDISGMHNGLLEIEHTFKFPLLENDSMNTPHNPYIRGNYLISSYYEDGVQVFDVTDPLNPIPVAHYDTHPSNTTYTGYKGNWGVFPFLPSGIILASDIDHGLFVLSLDSIDLKPIPIPSVTDISQVFDNEMSFCDGNSVSLELPSGAEEYHWFINDTIELDETSNVLIIDEPGSYSAMISNKQCQSTSNIITIIENQLPDISSFPTNNLQFCQGEDFGIEVTSGYEIYEWYKDDILIENINANFLSIENSGMYSLNVTSTNGCSINSMPIEIEFLALPPVEINAFGPTTFCEGNWINIEAMSNIPIAGTTWMFNDSIIGNTNVIQANQTGIYEVEITDNSGCTNISEIEITVLVPIVPTVTVDVNILSSTTANHYQWFGDNGFLQGEDGQTLTITESGTYYVSAIDENGCSSNSIPVFVEYTTSILEMETIRSVQIFPNPANEILNVNIDISEADQFNFEIWSTDGKLLLEKSQNLNSSNLISFDISTFAKGIYFLKIKNDKGEMVSKVVKL